MDSTASPLKELGADLTPLENALKLANFSIDEYRPMRVVVIGAGFSGIIAGYRYVKEVQNLELVIYEKQPGVGGVWCNNRYPGVACDIPSHSYQIPFENNVRHTFSPRSDAIPFQTQWSSFYAPGAEIRQYLEDVVAKNDLMKYIKLGHELLEAHWDDGPSKWRLKIKSSSIEVIEDTADVLLLATGISSRWNWPKIEGLHDFKGTLMHSASWKDVEGWENKTVGVIGVGSSAIQIVPSLQPKVKRLVNFVRSKTWICPPWGPPRLNQLVGKDDADTEYTFSGEIREKFKDPAYYKQFRYELEMEMTGAHSLMDPKSEMQRQARNFFIADMKQRLAKKPAIAEHLIPNFAVGCRRLTPGPGYLEALCEDNVDFVPKDIKRVTTMGIEAIDGEHTELDVIICATGFDLSFRYPFPVTGRRGISLQEKFAPHPVTYLGVCVDGFPNMFLAGGPNASTTTSSYITFLDKQIRFGVEATKKIQRERLKSIEVKKEAVEDFDEYLEAYFPGTVHFEKCRTWFKCGKEEGRVVALWPGSGIHGMVALSHPRWEDFNYEKVDNVRNRFYWLGDGQTVFEKTKEGNRAWYLDEYFN